MATKPAADLKDTLKRTGEVFLIQALLVDSQDCIRSGGVQVRFLEVRTITDEFVAHGLKITARAESGVERDVYVAPESFGSIRRAIKKIWERLERVRREVYSGVFDLTFRDSDELLLSVHVEKQDWRVSITVGDDRPDLQWRAVTGSTDDTFLPEFDRYLKRCDQLIEERRRMFGDL